MNFTASVIWGTQGTGRLVPAGTKLTLLDINYIFIATFGNEYGIRANCGFNELVLFISNTTDDGAGWVFVRLFFVSEEGLIVRDEKDARLLVMSLLNDNNELSS